MLLQNLLPNTRSCYEFWNRKFCRFIRIPAREWAGRDVRAFMLWLYDQNYSAVSCKQALNAIKFTFDHVLKADMGHLDLPPMPVVRQTLRTVPTREEIARILTGLSGQVKLMVALMYGSGLRVGCECCVLRVKDINIASKTIDVWDSKGMKCRRTVLPVALVPALQRHLAWRKALHEQDLAEGKGYVELPGRLAVKYKSAPRELGWQFLFPSALVRGQYRWHATDESVAKQMRKAIKAAGITKRITPHTLRHGFTTHLFEAGCDPVTIKNLLGHEDFNTTMIYAHGDAAKGFSPMDFGPRPVAVANPCPRLAEAFEL
jgi:site-specific recombinase XerD